MKILILLMMSLLVSCDQGDQIAKQLEEIGRTPRLLARVLIGDNEEDSNKEDDIEKLEKRVDDHESRLKALETLVHLTRELDMRVYDLESLNLGIVIDDLYENISSVQDSVNDLQVPALNSQVLQISNVVNNLQTIIDQNNSWQPLNDCDHSYFVLYNVNGSINKFYFTEYVSGNVGGAWVVKLNRNYNLVLNGSVLCTNVRVSSSSKKLFYTSSGTSKEVDLSY